MNINDIRIGQHVRFVGNSIIPPITGVVEDIYYPYPEDDADYPGSVSMRPDRLPEIWPY
jgi:hypothetical protein